MVGAAAAGAALVVASGGALGLLLASPFARRPEDLESLGAVLRRLAVEIEYAVPLTEALRAAERDARGVARVLVGAAARRLASGDGATAAEAWAEAVAVVHPRSALTDSDRRVLLDLGASLGATGRAEQRRHLDVCLERLGAAEAEAQREAQRQVRLRRFLGVLAGIGIAILCL